MESVLGKGGAKQLIQATEQTEYSSEWSNITDLGEQVITALSENLWPPSSVSAEVYRMIYDEC